LNYVEKRADQDNETQNGQILTFLDLVTRSNELKAEIKSMIDKYRLPIPEYSLLKKVGKFTIDGPEGSIELFSIDENNPVVKRLLKQTDDAFAENEVLQDKGCVFMTTMAFVQMVTGKTLSSVQILDIWNKAVKDAIIMDSKGFVNNPDSLANLALKMLGRSDIGITFGETEWAKTNATLVGYRIYVPYTGDEGGKHTVAGGLLKSLIYDPGNSYNRNHKYETGVYVYAISTK
jgi:hypothetical protein